MKLISEWVLGVTEYKCVCLGERDEYTVVTGDPITLLTSRENNLNYNFSTIDCVFAFSLQVDLICGCVFASRRRRCKHRRVGCVSVTTHSDRVSIAAANLLTIISASYYYYYYWSVSLGRVSLYLSQTGRRSILIIINRVTHAPTCASTLSTYRIVCTTARLLDDWRKKMNNACLHILCLLASSYRMTTTARVYRWWWCMLRQCLAFYHHLIVVHHFDW